MTYKYAKISGGAYYFFLYPFKAVMTAGYFSIL